MSAIWRRRPLAQPAWPVAVSNMTVAAHSEAAEILHRAIELLPKVSSGQSDYLQGVAIGLELETSRRLRVSVPARQGDACRALEHDFDSGPPIEEILARAKEET